MMEVSMVCPGRRKGDVRRPELQLRVVRVSSAFRIVNQARLTFPHDPSFHLPSHFFPVRAENRVC